MFLFWFTHSRCLMYTWVNCGEPSLTFFSSGDIGPTGPPRSVGPGLLLARRRLWRFRKCWWSWKILGRRPRRVDPRSGRRGWGGPRWSSRTPPAPSTPRSPQGSRSNKQHNMEWQSTASSTRKLASRPTLSQFQGFKISWKTLANYIKFLNPRILRLLNCERARRVKIYCCLWNGKSWSFVKYRIRIE